MKFAGYILEFEKDIITINFSERKYASKSGQTFTAEELVETILEAFQRKLILDIRFKPTTKNSQISETYITVIPVSKEKATVISLSNKYGYRIERTTKEHVVSPTTTHFFARLWNEIENEAALSGQFIRESYQVIENGYKKIVHLIADWEWDMEREEEVVKKEYESTWGYVITTEDILWDIFMKKEGKKV